MQAGEARWMVKRIDDALKIKLKFHIRFWYSFHFICKGQLTSRITHKVWLFHLGHRRKGTFLSFPSRNSITSTSPRASRNNSSNESCVWWSWSSYCGENGSIKGILVWSSPIFQEIECLQKNLYQSPKEISGKYEGNEVFLRKTFFFFFHED